MKSILKPYPIKKFMIALIFTVIIIPFGNNLMAQDADFDFSVEITRDGGSKDNSASIIISVAGSDSRYIFMIYDKDPLQGGEKIVTESKSNKIHTINNLKPGKYSVCVKNRNNVTR